MSFIKNYKKLIKKNDQLVICMYTSDSFYIYYKDHLENFTKKTKESLLLKDFEKRVVKIFKDEKDEMLIVRIVSMNNALDEYLDGWSTSYKKESKKFN